MITAIAGSSLFEPVGPAPLPRPEKTEREDPHSTSARLGEWALGRYKLDELIGSGGMSTVYAATHRANGRRVAVKVMHARLASIEDAVERFRAEAIVANKVDHPGAIAIFDEGTMDDGAPCIVMEKLVGGSLDQQLDGRGPLPLHETMLVLDRLLDVLAAAHRAGVVHRDVKPDNVFVTTDGEVKLLDFGIARNESAESATQTGQIMGTPAYMPPEQAEGRWKEVDQRADVFAAGAVALALLLGESPRIAETPNLTLLAAMSVPLEGVRARALAVPPAIASVVDRAIASARSERHPTAQAMRDALRTAWNTMFGASIESDDAERRLAGVGRSLESPPRTSGVQRTAKLADRAATRTLDTRDASAITITERSGPPTLPMTITLRSDPVVAEVPRARAKWPLSPAWLASVVPLLPTRREWLVGAVVVTVVLGMVTGIGLARLFGPDRASVGRAAAPAPTTAPLPVAAVAPAGPEAAPVTIVAMPLDTSVIPPAPPLAQPPASKPPAARGFRVPGASRRP